MNNCNGSLTAMGMTTSGPFGNDWRVELVGPGTADASNGDGGVLIFSRLPGEVRDYPATSTFNDPIFYNVDVTLSR